MLVATFGIGWANWWEVTNRTAGVLAQLSEFDDITRTLSKSKDEESRRLLQGLQELGHKIEEKDK